MDRRFCKISLALAIALLVCLLPMPYGYYTLVRFVAMIVFGCLAFSFYEEEKMMLCIVFCSLALLFQPFIKIALGRTMWNVVDVVVAMMLFILCYKNNN